MLQQILKDMFIDPELLEELGEDQKQVLFFKMREEQIRRWKVREEEIDLEEKPKSKKVSSRNIHFLCDNDDKIAVTIMKDADDEHVIDFAARKKKEEEEALKRAETQAKKEAEEKRKKEMEEIAAKRKAEEMRLQEEKERLRKERELKEAELKKKAEETEALKSLKEAKLQREKAELAKRELEYKRLEEEKKRDQEMEEIRKREEAAKKKQEEEAQKEEKKRKAEIYERLKLQKEEELKQEQEEASRLQAEWEDREKKAKEADKQRRSSISQTRNELTRLRKLARDKQELNNLREDKLVEPDHEEKRKVFKETVPEEKERKKDKKQSFTFGSKKKNSFDEKGKCSPTTRQKESKNNPPVRPPLPERPTISSPVTVTGTRTERETFAVKRDIVKPSRPPPPPTQPATDKKSTNKPPLPPRPKGRDEVVKWWKENEYNKLSGLDENKKPLEWFHGIISRQEAERLLESKDQGSYLARVSERVWGYTISYKDIVRCKHFLIDTSSGYQFFGTEQRIHQSLNELINYHKRNPISGLGQEILRNPVGQDKTPPDYGELFVIYL